jgi:hypothetical protein
MARADLGKPIIEPYEKASRSHIVDLFYKILLKEQDYEDQLFQLLRLMECFPSLSFSGTIKPALLSAASDQPRASMDDLLAEFVAAPYADPMTVQAIPQSLKASFLEQLTSSGYQHSNQLIHERESTGNANSHDMVSYVFTIQRALATNDDNTYIELSNVIPSSLPKRQQREITRNRIHALLNTSNVREALDLIASFLSCRSSDSFDAANCSVHRKRARRQCARTQYGSTVINCL